MSYFTLTTSDLLITIDVDTDKTLLMSVETKTGMTESCARLNGQ